MNITGGTRVLGIFGDPVRHSLSPVMQNAALQGAGIDAVYLPFRVRSEELASAVRSLRALNLWGVNVTIPHKEQVLPYLDELDSLAARIGAVNTIVNRDGMLTGFNTDAPGLLASLAEDLAFLPVGRRVLLLGAGGATRAALVALVEAGAAWIGVANRTRARGEQLVENFREVFPGTEFAALGLSAAELSAVFPAVDLVINSTSLGLHGEVFDVLPWHRLSPQAVVLDMVYSPDSTPLVAMAREHGHRAADGLGMLVGQGEEAFALWTGRRPEPGLMKKVLRDWLGGRNTHLDSK
jgi:shikimate dehydrogenase